MSYSKQEILNSQEMQRSQNLKWQFEGIANWPDFVEQNKELLVCLSSYTAPQLFESGLLRERTIKLSKKQILYLRKKKIRKQNVFELSFGQTVATVYFSEPGFLHMLWLHPKEA